MYDKIFWNFYAMSSSQRCNVNATKVRELRLNIYKHWCLLLWVEQKKKERRKKPSQISIEMALCVVEEAFQLVHAHDTCETVVINPKHTSVFLCPCLSNYILELWNEIFNMCIHPCNFKIITLRLKLKVLMKPLILMKRSCSKHHLLKPNLSCLSTIGW